MRRYDGKRLRRDVPALVLGLLAPCSLHACTQPVPASLNPSRDRRCALPSVKGTERLRLPRVVPAGTAAPLDSRQGGRPCFRATCGNGYEDKSTIVLPKRRFHCRAKTIDASGCDGRATCFEGVASEPAWMTGRHRLAAGTEALPSLWLAWSMTASRANANLRGAKTTSALP